MIATEPRTPPAEYLPDRVALKPVARKPPVWWINDLPEAIYSRWPHEPWALRHWRTGHNVHVEHWHCKSLPGAAR